MNARDFTRKQFHQALERNGFARPVMWWIMDRTAQREGRNGTSYGVVVNLKGKILRRETLAHILKARDKDRAKQEQNQ